jgi:hypothetical protein
MSCLFSGVLMLALFMRYAHEIAMFTHFLLILLVFVRSLCSVLPAVVRTLRLVRSVLPAVVRLFRQTQHLALRSVRRCFLMMAWIAPSCHFLLVPSELSPDGVFSYLSLFPFKNSHIVYFQNSRENRIVDPHFSSPASANGQLQY